MNTLRQLLPDSAARVPTNHLRFVRVTGADAATFLQGQLSNDINALETNPAQLASFNSPKGRVLALLRVLKPRGEYWLAVDDAIADGFVQRLQMFVLRSKVSIAIAPELAGTVVIGPHAPAALQRAGLPAPLPGQGAARDELVLFGLPGPVPRVEIFGPRAALPELGVDPASAEDLARWDILFRLPRILPENRDAHVAQHLDLDELGAISFRKGCYTGQEIIARMKYLGKVKKRTGIFTGRGANAGDSVRNDDDRSVGEVVNIADADGMQLILASVNLDDADQPLRVNESVITPVSKSNSQD